MTDPNRKSPNEDTYNGWTQFTDYKNRRVRVDSKSKCPLCGSKLSIEFQINKDGQTAINCTSSSCQWWTLG